VVDHDDLAVLARDRVPTSNFLRRQLRILYYGFYDLTQVQLDLFQAVARAYPTTLYFPLIKGDPGFLFAQRFFERYIHGLVTEPIQREALGVRGTVEGEGEGTRSNRPACRIVNVSGRWDEVTVVAKDILGLVEERGYTFHDIGVVARTLSGYETVVPRVFDQHGIPFQSTMGRTLASFPYPKAAAQLLGLRVSGFRRDQVMDLLSSPFLRITDLCTSNPRPRPDLWDIAGRRLGITRGLDSWGRLTAFQESGLLLHDDEDGEGTGPRIPPEQIYGLWTAVSTLSEILGSLPETGLWDEYAAQAEAIIERVLDPRAGDPNGDKVGEYDTVAELFRAGLDELRELGRLGQAVSLEDFVAALQRLIEEMTVPLGSAHGSGVEVLDAMAARGLPFRALFILGLNEKVFPRHIHEDAFLRDRVRRLLEVDLGFKIQEKLAGYDEERLLFSLLCSAARHHLTLLYQRADEAGRTLVPSAYLGDMKRAWGGDAEVAVPRRLTKKFREGVQFRLERLTPSELVVKLLLDRRVPRRLLEAGYPTGRIVEQGLAALPWIDSLEPRLGAYDGITGPLQTHWGRLMARGVSPTSLERYAMCPFRYFAEHVLRLELMTVPETVDQVGPMELGRLAHDILRTCLQTFHEEGGFAKPPRSRRDPLELLNLAARSVFEEFARSHPVGYLLLWELAQERLLEFLRTVL
ncbi:MAG: PD-(D/E)XK nuclease family protein, partial [Nitrospiraceae bacterium]